jgi:methylenetetrahydrofolate dehydrogenase (NADP+) / methenyltetrahydrofolate cyclohydrolase
MSEAKIIDGKRIAEEFRADVKKECEEFKSKSGITPRIVFILVGNNPASELYVKNKGVQATEAGFSNETLRFPETITQQELLAEVEKINRDPVTHALLVQLPLPKHIDEGEIIDTIAPEKDVDGLNPFNAGRLMIGRGDYFAPCTPAGVVEMLHREGIDVSGKHVVVVGRSNLVGKPLGLLFVQKAPKANAVITIAHTGAGKRLGEITRQADILVAAVGVPKVITADMVKDGVVVVDVGINRIDDATRKSGYRTVGDVDFDNVKLKASAITPVPGGVGPMTIAMLLKNTLEAAKRSVKA